MKLRGNPRLKAVDRHLLGAAIRVLGSFKGQPKLRLPPRRILLVKLNALGDTLLFLALARLLKRNFPDVRVDFLGSEINLPVLQRSSYLDNVLHLELNQLLNQPRVAWKLIALVRRNSYDVLIDGSQWERITALIALFSRSRATIGFNTLGQRRASAFHYALPHRREQHEIDCFFELLRPLGIAPPAQERYADYIVASQDEQGLLELALPPQPWIVLHPGCGAHGSPRQWRPERFAELAQQLQNEFPQHAILLTGGADEASLCAAIAEQIRNVTDLSGRLKFHLLGALVQQTALLVCGNTGVMHLAAALKTPLVALHGPTDPRRWGPLSDRAVVIQSKKECVPCLYLGFEYSCECPDCMAAITVAEVFAACRELLMRSEAYA